MSQDKQTSKSSTGQTRDEDGRFTEKDDTKSMSSSGSSSKSTDGKSSNGSKNDNGKSSAKSGSQTAKAR